MEKILSILENDCNTPLEQIALLTGLTVEEAAAQIDKLKKDKILLGNKSIINWEKTNKEFVTALIELKVTPQRGEGFDKVAERIYKYPQVKSLYLMSGAYDLANRGQEYERSGIVRCAEACTDGFDNFNGNSFCAKKIQRGRNCIRGR